MPWSIFCSIAEVAVAGSAINASSIPNHWSRQIFNFFNLNLNFIYNKNTSMPVLLLDAFGWKTLTSENVIRLKLFTLIYIVVIIMAL